LRRGEGSVIEAAVKRSIFPGRKPLTSPVYRNLIQWSVSIMREFRGVSYVPVVSLPSALLWRSSLPMATAYAALNNLKTTAVGFQESSRELASLIPLDSGCSRCGRYWSPDCISVPYTAMSPPTAAGYSPSLCQHSPDVDVMKRKVEG
jgi:hypothetical protein